MKKIFLSLSIILVMAVIFFGFAPKVSAGTTFGRGWSSRPVKVYAGGDLNANERDQLQQAINAWNSTRFGTFLVYGGIKNSVPLYTTLDGYNTVSKLSLSNGNAAQTYSVANPSSILEANVVLNSNVTFNYGAPTTGKYYLKSVLMHELGHVLGLADNTDSGSIMYLINIGSTTISSRDLSDLSTIY